MARFEAVLLDFANTVAQYDRPQMQAIHGDSWASYMVGAHAAGMATCRHRGMIAGQDHERRYATYGPDFTIEHLARLSEILAPA